MTNAVLWLVSWYPNRLDPFDGDFIERHAMAVSSFQKLTVLYIAKDGSLKENSVEIEKTGSPQLTVYKVYYGRSGWPGPLERLFSLRTYLRLQKKIYREIIAESGTPDIVHVHVAMKAGLLAYWLKKIYHIPFVVTEHWSGYYPKTAPNIYNSNWLQKKLNKKVLDGAALFLPVSANLGNMVNEYFTTLQYKVIPNTVDTNYFYYQPGNIARFRFIHPSSMIDIKNPEGILRACKLVKEGGYEFELLMIGSMKEKLLNMSQQYGVQGIVVFKDAVPYIEVAKEMQQSSALLMFSRFENLPCIVLEALCCGLPVICSRVGGVPEVVDVDNGILVESENETALAEAMKQMIDTYTTYNRAAIASKAAALFNYDQVGMQYSEVYKSILNKH